MDFYITFNLYYPNTYTKEGVVYVILNYTETANKILSIDIVKKIHYCLLHL